MKKKIGLYFGTFNPIHTGHLVIANHMAEFTDLDEIWLVVTPHNPFKKKKSLLEDYHRYELVYRATENYPKLKPSKIEFDLPQPSYTVNTVVHLEEKHPEYTFSLIMGEDNLLSFHKWKNSEVILEKNSIYVYPRITEKVESPLINHPNIKKVAAPIMEISASFIRKSIREQKNVRPLIPEPAWFYIEEMNFYKS